MRAAADLAVAANDKVRVHSIVDANHMRILRKNAAEVADAVESLTR